MRYRLINEKFPVWEIDEFILPDVDLQTVKTYDQGYVSSSSHLRQQCKPALDQKFFCDVWDEHTKELQRFMRNEMNDIEEVRQMWMGNLQNFVYPPFSLSGEFIEDKEGFDMAPHIDNRNVVGVLIINLINNPDNSGTRFVDMSYNGPTKKHTGVFMLNNYNTRHGIVNPGPGNRLIGYQMLHIDSICK